MSNWLLVLLEPARALLTQIGQFLANVLLVVLVLLIGWIIAKVIKSVVTKVLNTVKLDELSSRIELEGVLEKGGIKVSLSELVGIVCYWLALLLSVVIAVNAVGLTIAADLLNKIILYIPNVIAAIFILVLGMFIATLLRNIVQTAAMNAGLSEVKVLSRAVEITVIVFAVLIALEQLNIGAKVIELTIGIVLGSLGLAFAIAVGFGARDVADRLISEWVDKLRKK